MGMKPSMFADAQICHGQERGANLPRLRVAATKLLGAPANLRRDLLHRLGRRRGDRNHEQLVLVIDRHADGVALGRSQPLAVEPAAESIEAGDGAGHGQHKESVPGQLDRLGRLAAGDHGRGVEAGLKIKVGDRLLALLQPPGSDTLGDRKRNALGRRGAEAATAAARLRANMPRGAAAAAETGRSAARRHGGLLRLGAGAAPPEMAADAVCSTSSTAINCPTDTAVAGLRPHLCQNAGDGRFDLHRGLVGLDLQQRLAPGDLLARADNPSHDADFRLGRGQVGHFHLVTHVIAVSENG